MAEKVFNCIICPKCCTITRDGTRYEGAGCKRGEAFVAQELVSPRRTLTTTVKCKEGTMVALIPVKSRESVPLAEIGDLVARIKQVTFATRPAVGSEICIEDILFIITG